MIHVSLQPVPGYLQLSLYKENIRMDHGVMGVSTSRGILTMVARQDKLSCVNDSCLSTASSWLPSAISV